MRSAKASAMASQRGPGLGHGYGQGKGIFAHRTAGSDPFFVDSARDWNNVVRRAPHPLLIILLHSPFSSTAVASTRAFSVRALLMPFHFVLPALLIESPLLNLLYRPLLSPNPYPTLPAHPYHPEKAFGSLYRADIARYRREGSAVPAFLADIRRTGRWGQFGRTMWEEMDGALPKGAPKGDFAAGRYYGSAAVQRERSRTVRRFRPWATDSVLFPQSASASSNAGKKKNQQQAPIRRKAAPLPATVPLPTDTDGPQAEAEALALLRGDPSSSSAVSSQFFGAGAGGWAKAETLLEWLLRRTKDYNQATRERPYDVQLWLDFAAFQVLYLKHPPK